MVDNQNSRAEGSLPEGVYDVDYFEGRKKKRQLIYRLKRRTDEVEQSIRKYLQKELSILVDVGTADGLMLDNLHHRIGPLNYVGLDYNRDLLSVTSSKNFNRVQSDALALPFLSAVADVVVATAIIEHVDDPNWMMSECKRILNPGGLFILTTPDPFMEMVATKIGLLQDAGHQETLNLKKLRYMLERQGWDVLEARKFMFSPIGFPAEKTIERIFGPLGLSLVMANQLIVARNSV